MVRVVFTAALRSATAGEANFDLQFTGELSSLFSILKERYGETFERRLFENGGLKRYVNVYVDGKDVRFLSGQKTPVSGDSEVLFIPAVSGG